MRRTTLILVAGLCALLLAVAASSQVLRKEAATEARAASEARYLQYEGFLSDPSGHPLDGEHAMTFRIYDSPSSESSLWEETHQVDVEGGELSVVLGKDASLPSLSEGSYYIGVMVNGEELQPRHRIVGGQIASEEPAPVGGGPDADPYVSADAEERYVNVVGDTMVGDLYVDTQIGVGTRTPLSILEAQGASAAWPVIQARNTAGGTALGANSNGSSAGLTTAVYGNGSNTSTGAAYGARFLTGAEGTGTHYGVDAEGFGASSSTTYGLYGFAQNTSSGEAYGGLFSAPAAGTGSRYGSRSEGASASSAGAYGSYGYAENTSSGPAYGGRFYAAPSGTGTHYGLYSTGNSSTSSPTYGSYNYASNTADGPAYGGYFETAAQGTGSHYGLSANAAGSSISNNYGCYASAGNGSSGWTYAGYFSAPTGGTGRHYGIYTSSVGASAQVSYGIDSYAENTSSGPAYAGSFYVAQSGTGTHIGVSSGAFGSSAGSTYGVSSGATNSGTGNAYGGYFTADNLGSGTHYGVYGVESAGGSGAAVYAAGDMIASGAKPAVVKTSSGHRLLYAQESPEVWFEDFGEGRLVNGRAHIDLDPLFLETVTIDAEHPMKVFIQLNDEECKGTAVKRGTTEFDVVELLGGTSNASFSYRVVAKRKGYEDERLRETGVGYDDPNLYPELLSDIERSRAEEGRQREEMQGQHPDERGGGQAGIGSEGGRPDDEGLLAEREGAR